ncbi:hypothetical protein BURMUCGD1_4829 [Burkholderia multivorans CGD1]|nr:hypothetical protein BURMUCGD1_4829 [Burkholderia multivorans CGD1]
MPRIAPDTESPIATLLSPGSPGRRCRHRQLRPCYDSVTRFSDKTLRA